MSKIATIVALAIVGSTTLVDSGDACADTVTTLVTSYVLIGTAQGYVGAVSGGYVLPDGTVQTSTAHPNPLFLSNAAPSLFGLVAKQLAAPGTARPRLDVRVQTTTVVTTCTPRCPTSDKDTWDKATTSTATSEIDYTGWAVDSISADQTSTMITIVAVPTVPASSGAVGRPPAAHPPDSTPPALLPFNSCQVTLVGTPLDSKIFQTRSVVLNYAGNYSATLSVTSQDAANVATWGGTNKLANGTPTGGGKVHCVSAPTTAANGTVTAPWSSQWTLGYVGVGTTTSTTAPLTFRTASWSL